MHPEQWEVIFFGPDNTIVGPEIFDRFDSFDEADSFAGFMLGLVTGEWSALVAPALDNDSETD